MTDLSSPAKRSRLAARHEPYFTQISGPRGGISLGWRPGRWLCKVVKDGRRMQGNVAAADDHGVHDGVGYKAAIALAMQWASHRRHEIDATQAAEAVPTVRSAVEAYIATRTAADARTAAITGQRLARHVLSDKRFSGLPLVRLTSKAIEEWRHGILSISAPATMNRLLNDLRAALNQAFQKHHKQLPAGIVAEIRVGTKRLRVAADKRARKAVLSDDQVHAVVGAAYDEDTDFGHLVLLAAATGARYSQLAALKVADLLSDRVVIPGSKKGRSAEPHPPVAVPLSRPTRKRLQPLVDGRNDFDAPLLLRWAYVKGKDGVRWEKHGRVPLGAASQIGKPWARVVKAAGLPQGTPMYCLRHSSVVRGLKAGLPVRLVAAQHDTSSAMIEMHYSHHISSASQDMARRTAL